jgi:hypothetical protein
MKGGRVGYNRSKAAYQRALAVRHPDRCIHCISRKRRPDSTYCRPCQIYSADWMFANRDRLRGRVRSCGKCGEFGHIMARCGRVVRNADIDRAIREALREAPRVVVIPARPARPRAPLLPRRELARLVAGLL